MIPDQLIQTLSEPISDQKLLLILIFVFAVIALLALGARSFTQLVELILSNGSKLEVLMQELLRRPTLSSQEKAPNTSSLPTEGTPTTPDNQSGNSTDTMQGTK